MTLEEQLLSDGFNFTPVLDNQFQRFDHDGGTLNGWFIGTEAFASYGDWRKDKRYHWSPTITSNWEETQEKWREHIKVMEEAKRAKAEGQEEIARDTELTFDLIWKKYGRSATHPYLVSKGIDHNYKAVHIPSKKTLYIHFRDSDDKVWTYQYIYPDLKNPGKFHKRFLKGGKKKGCYHVIPGRQLLETAKTAYIVEGFATGCSVYAATSLPVVVAGDTHNLAPVADAIAKRYPSTELIFAADNDHLTDGNPGITKAKGAAVPTRSRVIAPQFKQLLGKSSTDWNDLHQQEGLEAVKRQLSPGARPKKDLIEPITLEQLYHDTPDKIDWLVEECLPKAGLSIMAGVAKVGKTTIVRQLCQEVMTPITGSFLTRKVNFNGPVLYFSLDEDNRYIAAHLKKLGVQPPAPLHIWKTPQVDERGQNCAIDSLRRYFDKFGVPKLVIMDTMTRTLGIKDPDNYAETTEALGNLRVLAGDADTHILVTHHLNKAIPKGAPNDKFARIMGSNGIASATDTNLLLERTNTARFVSSQGRSVKAFDELHFEYDHDTGRITPTGEGSQVKETLVEDKIMAAIVDLPTTEHSVTNIRKHAGVRTDVATRTLLAICQGGRAKKHQWPSSGKGKGRAKFYYTVNEGEDVPPIVKAGEAL